MIHKQLLGFDSFVIWFCFV